MFADPSTGEWIILSLSAAFILTTIFMLFIRNTPRDRHISETETNQTIEDVLTDIQNIIAEENSKQGVSISSNKIIYKPDGRIIITPNKSLSLLGTLLQPDKPPTTQSRNISTRSPEPRRLPGALGPVARDS